jgi:2-hydroxychromene-2-carboxylate isomerase
VADLEFWFEFESTYSYLSAARIENAAAAAGVSMR